MKNTQLRGVTDPSHDVGLRRRIGNGWDRFAASVRGRFDAITRWADGGAAHRDERQRTASDIARFESEGGASTPYIVPAPDAQDSDFRGMGARAGRNDRPPPVPSATSPGHGAAHRGR